MISETKPLSGLVVADFTRILSGPTAAMILSDLGAEVVKVERPETGDDTRAWGPPFRENVSTYYLAANRGKRSVVLDLTCSRDIEVARNLIAESDVVLENFRPGAMEKLGLGYEIAKELNPSVIYCSISGFGSQGRGASIPGYDFIAQAAGGLMSITGAVEGEPMKVGVALVDILVANHALIAILAAHRRKAATGEGSHVEVNLLGSLLSSLANQGSAYVAGGEVPKRMGNIHPSIAPYELLHAKDDAIAVAVGNDKQFLALCGALGREDLAAEARYKTNSSRVNNRDNLRAELERSLQQLTAEDVLSRLEAAQVPSGPVNTISEAFQLAEHLGLEPIQKANKGCSVPQISPPFRFGGKAPQIQRDAPGLGEDDEYVRSWLGTFGRRDTESG